MPPRNRAEPYGDILDEGDVAISEHVRLQQRLAVDMEPKTKAARPNQPAGV